MMDRREYDRIRRAANPLQLDLIEAVAAGRLPRRDFLRMGAVLGVAGTTLVACGNANSTGSSGEAGVEEGVGVGGDLSPVEVQQGGTVKIATDVPASALYSVTMQDRTTYSLVSQCYEYLTYTSGDLQLRPGLAETWEPNDDGTEWTFTLRQDVTWQDGNDFTAEDVVATFGKLADSGNSALDGVLDKGATRAVDDHTVVFTLNGPNGNFPYLVSTDNAQAAILPKDQADGVTLDESPNGTGPWKLESFDAKTGATYVRNEEWWGGTTPLDGIEFVFFQDIQAQVLALQSGQVNAIVQFSVLDGQALLNNASLNVIALNAATHRQIWMRTDTGPFSDPRVREALAWTLDREAIVQSLFKGRAVVGADTVVAPVYPYADSSLPARQKDIAKAKALLSSAGVDGLSISLPAVKLQEVPDLAVLVKNDAAEAGITVNVSVEDTASFYGKYWCPEDPADPPCSGASDIGIVDYGHRATPDVYLNAALSSGGKWNSSQYASDEFDQAFKDFEAAIGVDEQRTAGRTISDILQRDTPAIIPYFYQYLSAHSTTYGNVAVTALGQIDLSRAGLAV